MPCVGSCASGVAVALAVPPLVPSDVHQADVHDYPPAVNDVLAGPFGLARRAKVAFIIQLQARSSPTHRGCLAAHARSNRWSWLKRRAMTPPTYRLDSIVRGARDTALFGSVLR